LLLLFGGTSAFNWQALAVLNFISLPYTIYSIYYQARVAKQWCVLCCTIQALLWLEFVPLALHVYQSPLSFLSFRGEGLAEAATLFICLLLPIIIWQMLKPLFLKLQQLRPVKNQLRRLKYNTEMFNKLLTEQPKFSQPDDDWSIVLGNVEAGTIITMVSNPYCPPCSKTHQELDDWLNRMDDVQLRIVFTANNNDNDIKTPVTRHLMALNELKDKTIVKRALHDWYEQKQKSYEAWAKLYPVELDEKKYNTLVKQKEWCDLAEIKATPTLLVNGYRLPEAYRLHDIKYMLG
jgi:protein-disulfide isomerase